MMQKSWKKWILSCFIMVGFVFAQGVYAQQDGQEEELPRLVFDEGISGKLEIEVHYGYWTMDLFKGLFEADLVNELSDEIADEITNKIGESGHSIDLIRKQHSLAFGSSGSDYGFELRFYPGGRYSSFSLGVSIEKMHMKATVEGPVAVHYDDGSYAEMDAVGIIDLNPLFTNLSFRWDFKPEWVVTPYFVLGLGIAALNGDVSYEYTGTYYWAGGTEDHTDSDSRSIKEAEEDSDVNLPNILPLLQINIGVRAEVIPHLHLRAEAGIWNGLILRGGLAFRF
jgi:hypothetical protein